MKRTIMTIAALAAAGMVANATELYVGQGGGLNEFTYNNVASGATAGQDYTMNAGTGFANGIALASDSSGVNVIHDGGLSHFNWDGTSFSANGYAGFPGGTAVAIASDGTILSTQGGGLNAWTHDGVNYTGTGFYGFAGARDLAIDAAGYIHVLHDGGISAFTTSGGNIAAVGGGFHGGIVNGNSIEIDANGNIFAARDIGINALTFDGSAYTLGGWWGIGTSDLDISSDGTVFAARSNGWDLDALTYDGANFTQTGYAGGLGGDVNTVFVDSGDAVHLGRTAGILEMDYAVVGGDVNANLTIGDYYGLGGVQSFAEVIPEPATLGLFGLIGGGMLWMRKRFIV